MMNHKDAGAFEKRAPTIAEWQKEQNPTAMGTSPSPKNMASPPNAGAGTGPGSIPHDILVVVSKTKDYVRAKHSLNTSQEVMEVLSDRLRSILDDASKRALQDGRKTLMDRDFR